jgi:hypothetical protein
MVTRDPYQLLHDNGFPWDDVNAIAAILDHYDLDIVGVDDIAAALASHQSTREPGTYQYLVDGDHLADPHEFAEVILAHRRLPTAAMLRGLAPGITGGMRSDEWVRRIRDEQP